MENNEKELATQESMGFQPVSVVTESDLETALKSAERQEEVIRKIKVISIRQTNKNDWVDMQGKPYLQSSGAEKIARVFGVSWQICNEYPRKSIISDETGNYYMYECKGKFTLGKKSIEIIGTCSQKDKFFGKSNGEQKPASEIDECSIIKKANTNMIVRGITTILGIRNITWKDIEEAGIKQDSINKVTYKSAKDITGIVMDIKTKTGTNKEGKPWTMLTLKLEQADKKTVIIQTFDAKEGIVEGVEITASGIEQKTYNGKTYFQAKTITINENIDLE